MEEFEEFNNLTNSTFESDGTALAFQYTHTWDVILVILYIFGICIDAATVYTIFRFKKLSTVPNVFIANWCIADIFLLIVTRFHYKIFELLEGMKKFRPKIAIASIVYETEYALKHTFMFFVVAVSIDWFLASYFSRASQRFRRYYKFVIGCIWTFALTWLCVCIGLYSHELYFGVTHSFSYFVYIVFSIFIVVLHSFVGVQKCRKKSSEYPTLMLTLTTILVMCWIPYWLILEFFYKILYHYCYLYYDCYYLSHSVATFIVLYRSNKDFHACFQQVVKCSRNTYASEVSEFESFTENINIENELTQPIIYQNVRGGH